MAKDFDQWDESKDIVSGKPDDHDWTMKSHRACVDEIARLQRCYDGMKARAERAERETTRVMRERNTAQMGLDRGLRTLIVQESSRIGGWFDEVNQKLTTIRAALDGETGLRQFINERNNAHVKRLNDADAKADRMETKLNQIVGHDQSEAEIILGRIAEKVDSSLANEQLVEVISAIVARDSYYRSQIKIYAKREIELGNILGDERSTGEEISQCVSYLVHTITRLRNILGINRTANPVDAVQAMKERAYNRGENDEIVARVRETLGYDWVDAEFDGDIVRGVQTLKIQLDHFNEMVIQAKKALDK